MELHEVKMVNPNVFMGMDVVKRLGVCLLSFIFTRK